MSAFKYRFGVMAFLGIASLAVIMGTCPWRVSAGDDKKDGSNCASAKKCSDDKMDTGSDQGDDESETEDDGSTLGEAKSDKKGAVTFNYFIRSGYAADSLSDIRAIGKVAGNDGSEKNYSVPQKVFVDLLDEKTELMPGDSLVVFDDMGSTGEPHSGFSKRLIKNLAIVKVREIQKKRCLVEIIRSFAEFEKGAMVKPLAREVGSWNKAQVKKNPPDHSIKCFVARSELGRENWNQADSIILTAGSKQGVVEGLVFELREAKSGDQEEVLRGRAKVFFTGPDYAVAEIISNSEGITSGFEAIYKP